MQIQLVKNEDGITEWIMMELPGTLTINDQVNGQNFGKLLWEKKDDGKEYVKTIIGRQLLQGECVELEKPFIVINRASQRKEKPENASKGDKKSCDVVAIIRRKIYFSGRPKPIIDSF
uniref:Uncharacterized protein n=2 Tax=Meloidogyne TaxID=189290 RepID=A0A915NQ00_9BILA